ELVLEARVPRDERVLAFRQVNREAVSAADVADEGAAARGHGVVARWIAARGRPEDGERRVAGRPALRNQPRAGVGGRRVGAAHREHRRERKDLRGPALHGRLPRFLPSNDTLVFIPASVYPGRSGKIVGREKQTVLTVCFSTLPCRR